MRAALLFLGLASCLSEEKYTNDYVAAECKYALTCYDDATLAFYDWASEDDCVAVRGPQFAGEVQNCVLDPKAGHECLKQLKVLACPGEGEDPELPAICANAFPNCDGTTSGPPDTDT